MRLAEPLERGAIYLRDLTAADATQRYLAWLSDPEVSRYLEVRFAPTHTQERLASFIDDCNTNANVLLLGIILKQDDRHIGNIKLGPIDWNHLTGEIGLLIGDRSQWGKGYARLAISLVSDYAFENLKLCKLTAGCYAGNEGSARAFAGAGFLFEGRRLLQWVVDGRRQDGLLLGKVNASIVSGEKGE